jgi:hypothetical protein
MAARSGGTPLTVEVAERRPPRAPGLARWLQATAPSRARGEVVVALVPDTRAAAQRQISRKGTLNDAYRSRLKSPVFWRNRDAERSCATPGPEAATDPGRVTWVLACTASCTFWL